MKLSVKSRNGIVNAEEQEKNADFCGFRKKIKKKIASKKIF